MDTLTGIAPAALMTVCGIAGVMAVIYRDQIGWLIVMTAANLAMGFMLYPFMHIAATVIGWIIAIGAVSRLLNGIRG